MTDLRAYLHPPWRSQEWLFWSPLQEAPLSTAKITFNGAEKFPDGFRGVVVIAEQIVARYKGQGDEGIRSVDLASTLRWNLLRNGVVVPGFLKRPSTWRTALFESDQAIDSSTAVDGWRMAGTTDSLVLRFPMIAPVTLKGGDRLDWLPLPPSIVVSFVGAFVAQGWLWDAKNEDERAEGSGADPWHG